VVIGVDWRGTEDNDLRTMKTIQLVGGTQ